MAANLESAFRSTISHGALSASIALSLTAIADEAAAQQPQTQGQGGNVVLDTVDVEARTQAADGEGAYAVQSASSPKQTAPLLDTPQTVTVIPQAIIQERGARNLTEVLRNTPGITFDAGENGFATSTNNFKLRGFDTSGSIFIDGSRDNGSYPRDTFNIERVEVFKGPAADNGRGSAGGYINMVTKSPILRNFIAGEVGFGFDEYDSKVRKRTTTDINYMVTPTTAIRLNGMWEDGGVAGREIAESNAWGFAPSIAFGLGTNARAIFSYEHLTRRDLPDWGVPGAAIPGLITFNPATAGFSRDSFYGLRSDFDDVDADTVLARFEYDFSDTATISNQTRWTRVDRFARYTIPTGFNVGPPATVPTSNQAYDRVNTTLTNLTNLSSEFYTGQYKHNLSTGLELTREKSSANRWQAEASTAPHTPFLNPNPNRPHNLAHFDGETNGIKVDTIATYLYDTIELNRYLEITGGLRAEHYKVDVQDSNGARNFRTSESTLGGKIGIVYKPVENVSYYASAGVSHLPPASYLSNPDISREGNNAFPGLIPGADPIRSVNYEVGVKWDFFGGRLSTTLALFHTDKRVPITGCDSIVVGGGGTVVCVDTPGLRGYGHQIAQGVELGIAGNLTDHWKVFGGLLWMKTERKHSAYLDLVRSNANRSDYGCSTTALTPCSVRTNGDEFSFTPNLSANLWTTYRFDNGWTLGGGVQYVGSSWIGRPDDAERIIPNGRAGKLPGYFLTHLMASYEIRKDVNIVFNVDNVFDKTHAVSTNWPASRATLGIPRTYRVSANFKY